MISLTESAMADGSGRINQDEDLSAKERTKRREDKPDAVIADPVSIRPSSPSSCLPSLSSILVCFWEQLRSPA
ncbi:MAG: hypothetical protein LW650_15000, partial [Planctomycetaceae bacterium]|nr:hypothetical protein [Planctomycetaceae bacterium]